ncbi:hypothetical protein [Siccirubricoccus sp. G192]|uniref:hypothetical protein n=1 Tax=Siccirubricoccus sp. G192 TaxID=2849651 RepID=UPI001C2C0A8A|nr:hypothetical protein [Siccirubricoccus sp. G192]MBV1799375.1 hypothetical protein [Siccirubricoccus sp. G192]
MPRLPLLILLAATAMPAEAQPLPPIAGPVQAPAEAPATPPPMPNPAGPQRERYRITLVPGAAVGQVLYAPYALLLDTATGQTWMLPPVQNNQPLLWTQVPFLSEAGARVAVPR